MNNFQTAWAIGIMAFILTVILALGAPAVLFAEPPAVDYKAIEELLKKVTANQPVLSLEVSREAGPSPIPGLQQVSFTVEMNGRRQKGVVYVSGSKIILGQMIDLANQQNLTALEAGPPEPVVYDVKDLDLEGRVSRGNPGGRLVIVEFSDFQCPYCRQSTLPLKQLLEKYPEDVALYYKHFPITASHPLAYRMAMATECARAQTPKAFWDFHDAIFREPEIKTEPGLREKIGQWSDKQGLDTEKLLTCYDKGEQAGRIQQDMADAGKIGVNATPTFLLNGEFVSGLQSLETFERYLRDE